MADLPPSKRGPSADKGKGKNKRGPRHDGRLAAVQFGYQISSQGSGGREDLPEFWDLRPASAAAREFAELIIVGVLETHSELDQRIIPCLEKYNLERISPVERAILRCATWELFYAPNPPPVPVVIDQALELAHRLGGSDSVRFVNGVIDRVAKGNEGGNEAESEGSEVATESAAAPETTSAAEAPNNDPNRHSNPDPEEDN